MVLALPSRRRTCCAGTLAPPSVIKKRSRLSDARLERTFLMQDSKSRGLEVSPSAHMVQGHTLNPKPLNP